MKRLLVLLVVLLTVPALGWVTGFFIQARFDGQLAAKGLPGSHELCANTVARTSSELRGACEEIDALELLQTSSLYVGCAVCAIPLLFLLTSLLIGSSRVGLAYVFPFLVRLSLFALAIIVVLQATIFVVAIYQAESYAIGRVHGVLLLIIGLGAIFVCFTLIKHALTLGGKNEASVYGARVTRKDFPALFLFVRTIATQLHARAPDNIVVGLEPTFFATSANVKLPNTSKPLKGETLFISLPLRRILTRDELAGVIGHELGHFRGKDTAYSLRFAPVYRGLASAFGSISDGNERDGAFALMALPAAALLSFMFDVFARNERKISRAREIEADRAATEVISPRAFGSALLKVAAFAPLWPTFLGANAKRLDRGLITRNMSMSFADIIRNDVDLALTVGRAEALFGTRISHPTDSHPPISERLRSLPGGGRDIIVEDVAFVEHDALSELGDFHDVEKSLTHLQHQLFLAAGLSHLPKAGDLTEDQQFKQATLAAAYVLGATILNAGGPWTAERWLAAASGGSALDASFSQLDFREHCRYPQDFVDASDAATFISSALNEEGRAVIIQWLRDIAFAGGAHTQESADWVAYLEHILVPPTPTS